MEFSFRPIATWPREWTKKRRRAPFRAGYNHTLQLLDRELLHLGARNVVFQIALTADEIRLDGRPRSGAKPTHPGVIVAFETKHGTLTYPCDTYDRFEDNVRAIALSLEALRAVDRYGVTRGREQYAGFAALPPPFVTEPPMTLDRAKASLQAFADGLSLSPETLAEVYRRAVKATHPDRGGDAISFRAVQRAKEFLESTQW